MSIDGENSERHLDPQLLYSLLLGGMDDEDALSLVLHHLASCPGCRIAFEEHFGVSGIEEIRQLEDPWYELAILREQVEGRKLLEGFWRGSYSDRLLRIEKETRLHRLGPVRCLLDTAKASMRSAPRRALEAATLAISILDRLHSPGARPDRRAPLTCLAWTRFANAWLLLGDPALCGQALDLAEAQLHEAEDDEATVAEVSTCRGVYYSAIHRIEDSRQSFEQALRQTRGSERADTASLRMNLANIHALQGRIDEGLESYEAVIADLGPGARLASLARVNAGMAAAMAGRDDSGSALEAACRSARASLQGADLFRIVLLEGVAFAAQGRHLEAREQIGTARRELAAMGRLFDAARAAVALQVVGSRSRGSTRTLLEALNTRLSRERRLAI